MPTDPEYLRRHYASLSDEALLAIDRTELVETAQQSYDDELERRKLPSQRSGYRNRPTPETNPSGSPKPAKYFRNWTAPAQYPPPKSPTHATP
jgi:phosphatidylserine/phosphatidylglycerophosphate/cardiolipin synthase-like enzyme